MFTVSSQLLRLGNFSLFQSLRYWRIAKLSLSLFLLGLMFTVLVGLKSSAVEPQETEILWDTVGVPHIYGKNDEGAFRAFGWAQMQSHGDLILRLYGQARGRAAEYWGEEYLDSDRWVQTMDIPERARAWYLAQNPTFRNYLDAFTAGINTYAQEHGDRIDNEVKAVLPVTPEDVLAHVQHLLHFTFVVNPHKVADISDEDYSAGSNAWAIAPSKSASGNAMLLANPHLPWSDQFLWYEAQITAPGIDAYGATLVGIPVLAIAFNDYLGWTHTVNTHDGWDAYELTLADKGYRFDGQVRAFETKTLALKVKQEDGTMHLEPLVVRRSVHGPIVAHNGKTLALRVVGLDQPGVLEEWWDMARATNLSEFEVALKRLQLPMFTVMYADREGHIMHLFNGQVPVRAKGDFEFWQGTIPGNTSDTLWTKTHSYEDLPRVIDPASGWLQNTNDPPWTTTFPLALDPNKFPPYMAPRFMDWRSQRSVKMLTENQKMSFSQMIHDKHSTRMELADRILDDLIPAARQQGSNLARRAADVLNTWDRQANADSRGAVLFAAWAEAMDFEQGFSQPWNEDSPLVTPDGLADPQSAVATLENAAAKVEKAYGSLDVAWGEVFRLSYGDVDLPSNGGSGGLGIFRVLDFAPSEDGRFQSVAGDSFVAAIEFFNPVRAMVLNSYGNATQPGSPHVGDQLQFFARKQLRPVWRSRPEIFAHLAERQVF